MLNTAQLSLDRADEQVECMIRQGAAFARVECTIDGAQFSQDHKAALWRSPDRFANRQFSAAMSG